MTRRDWLRSVPLSGVAATALPQLDRRPNILFIYTDDQRYDCLGVVQRELGELGRFPWFQTPNLDRLAQEGVRFRNAFVVHSLCTPSRASFLTGQYTHTHGIFTNFTPFPAGMVNFGSELTRAGYDTAYIGKWHMGRQTDRPGFTYAASYQEQGQYFDCPFTVQGTETATKGWVDDVATDFAIEYLRRRRTQPFAMVLGFKSPHNPFTPPPRLQSKWAGELMRPAQNHFELPIYLGRVHVAAPEHEKQSTATTGNRPIEDPLNYFRTIAGVDENVGRILNALDQLGLAEDTLVIYASDNGYHLREKGIGDKRSAYEVSMRIPMLLRYPRAVRGGQTNDSMVLNIDVAPTLLEFAGVGVPQGVQGRSWNPMLEGKKDRVRDAFLYEYFFSYGDITDYEAQTADPPITPNIVAVRTEDAKLIKYPGRTWVELFDLRKDPYERRNVAEDPRYRELRQKMQSILEEQIKDTGFRIPDKARHMPTEGLETWRK